MKVGGTGFAWTPFLGSWVTLSRGRVKSEEGASRPHKPPGYEHDSSFLGLREILKSMTVGVID